MVFQALVNREKNGNYDVLGHFVHIIIFARVQQSGSPRALIAPVHPQNLREWYHFVQGTHLIEIPCLQVKHSIHPNPILLRFPMWPLNMLRLTVFFRPF